MRRAAEIMVVKGKARNTAAFCIWLSKAFKGLTVVEACAIIIANPKLLQRVGEVPCNTIVRFNHNTIINAFQVNT